MSALKSRSNSLAGLTLDAVLGGQIVIQQYSPPEKSLETQTLFDIIREEYALEGHKDRTTWQIFREKLRLKRTGSAWTSSLPIPASDIPITVRPRVPMSDPPGSIGRGMFTRGSSLRVASTKNPDSLTDVNCSGDGCFKPRLSRHDSVKDHVDGEDDNRRRPLTFVEERQMSARGAIAAQEAAEAVSSDEDEEDDENVSGEEEENEALSALEPKQIMSLMDLLQETDREMGLTGSSYAMEEYEEDEDYEEDDDDDDDDDDEGGEGDLSCCVCMVKIKGASFSSCGHTFCKLCSKELMAQKGHCPVCSSFILEFLEIF